MYGPDNINRFNMYTSMKVNGSPADGYTSGQAIKAIEEVAAQSLLRDTVLSSLELHVRSRVVVEVQQQLFLYCVLSSFIYC